MPPRHPLHIRLIRHWPTLRWLPFALAAAASVAISALAPDGRRPFHVEWDVSLDALAFSLNKGPHVGATALIALLAVVATGRFRLGLAFALTVVVGACWELGQTTVIGHQARLADLAPDAFGALLGCGWGACVTWLADPRHRLPSRLRSHQQAM